MPLTSGTRLGPYEILGPLGAGGMGEVYRARDTRLDRTVAIKTLPDAVSGDPERRQRLDREARAIGALNHPNICALYDVGDHEGTTFLVMELVEGTTLADRLTRGPLPLDEALACAVQIANALDKAHRNGIVHRDLKPGNIMIVRPARQGPPQVKLLDFGLAKVGSDRPVIGDAATATSPVTRQGQILGTLHYMPPEQLEGRAVDERSDIFAFGAVLFEMLTGRRAFEGSSSASLIGAILHTAPPPVTDLSPGVPRAFDRLIAICLAKHADDRWSSIHDVVLQLQAIGAAPESVAAPSRAPARRREQMAWTAAALATAAALVLAAVLPIGRAGSGDDGERRVLSVLPPDEAPLVYGEAPQISPDGRRVAFVVRDRGGSTRLYVRELDGSLRQPLKGTEDAAMPFWAPDSRRLGFFSHGQLKTIDTTGGPPTAIAAAPVPRGGSWNSDDVILFVASPPQPPLMVPASGGKPVPVAIARDARDLRWFPRFLPDGRHYLYLGGRPTFDERQRVMVGSIDGPDSRDLVASNAPAVYAEPGYLLFRRDQALVAQPFDARTITLSGTAVPIADEVGYNAITYQGLFSASANGVLAYQDATPGSRITWFDRDGRRVGEATPAGDQNNFCLLSGESRIVYEAADPMTGNVDLWTVGSNGVPSRLTFGPPVDFFPVCAPEGDEVIFASLRDGPPNLFRLAVDAPGSDQLLLASPTAKVPTQWTRSGLVFFSILNAEFNWDIHALSLSDGSTAPVVATPAGERNGQLSPDGRWLAYVSDESGSFEVYVQGFPGTGVKWQVSRAGGIQPQWAASGVEIYYLEPDTSLVGRTLRIGPAGLVFGEPRVLMMTNVTGWEPNNQAAPYVATADGRRVVVNTRTDTLQSISVMINWTTILAR